MGFTPQEFDTAFAKVAEKHPSIRLSIAQRVVGLMSSLHEANKRKLMRERRAFGELIRESLNEANIKGKSSRSAYASLIGYIFGQHGQQVARMNRADPNRKPPRPKLAHSTLPPAIETKADGQLAWKL